MSTTYTSSLAFLSLNPRALSLQNRPTALTNVLSNFYSKSFSHVSLVSSLPARGDLPVSGRFTRNVAVASEYGQEEDTVDEDGEPNFSPDLKLFVGNLPFSVDSAQLAGLFESAGSVEMVEVIYDKVTGRSRGFGFVTMSTVEEVEAAAQQFNGYELEGRALRVNSGPNRQRDGSRPPRSSSFGGGGGGGSFDSSNRVYVGNLAWGVDNMALESLFSEQGKVKEAKVVYDRESGRSRGFGFVTYSSAEEVDNAIESLNGVELDGRAIRVSVAESRPRRQF